MVFVVRLLLLVALVVNTVPGLLRAQQTNGTHSSSNPATDKLQQLLVAQQQAVVQGNPEAVIATSQALSQGALDELVAVHAEQKRAQGQQATMQKFKQREQQLRSLLGDAFNDWGTAEARQQRYGDALKHFQEAEHWSSSTPGLMRNLGTAAFRLENYNESVRALSAAVAANPDDQPSRLMLAMSQFSLEQFAPAAQNFSRVSAMALDDPRTTYAWAYSLIRTNQPQQANAMAAMLEGKDLPPDIRLLVCKLYTASENYEQALKCLRTTEASAGDTAEVHYQIGATLLHMDRPADAIGELRTALKIEPRDSDAQYDLAFALVETSQKDEAIGLLRNLLAVNPQYPQAQYQLGKVLLDGGQAEEAVQHLEAAAKLTPDNDFVHYQLQVAYRRVGRTEDADRELKIYKDLKAGVRERATDRLNQNQKH